LHEELKRLDQDCVDVASLNTVKTELVMPSLVQHKDKGVKSLVACCLADILRLYAPDAPYNDEELRVPQSIPDFFQIIRYRIFSRCLFLNWVI
jgi:sister-chromatid-cohesion protein PDS5